MKYAIIICPHCGYELPGDEIIYQFNNKKCLGTCYMCGKNFKVW